MKIILNKIINYLYLGNRFRNRFYDVLCSLRDVVPQRPTILEAGAHTGRDTIMMNYAFKECVIHAFEPEPNAYKKLVKKTRSYSNIHTYNMALGNDAGERDLFISDTLRDASSSLLSPSDKFKDIYLNIELNKKIKVIVDSIDSWAQKNNIEKIDFMWLDMQGGELMALKSGENILKKVSAVYTEILKIQTYNNAPSYDQFIDWMSSRGFMIKERFEDNHDQVNVLFIRK